MKIFLINLFIGSTLSLAEASINVTDYGAVGDAVQFHVNTVSNSAVVVVNGTNIFSSADVGKAIEVFGCGTNTVGTNCQDMVTTIASVDGTGTNITVNQLCQSTLTNTFATVGTDNSLAFSNAIQSVVSNASTNTIINVPAGKYLCLAQFIVSASAPMSVLIYGGGWHLVGEGMTNTVLIGQGAWTYRDNYGPMRGFLLAIKPPVVNDYPVSIENLTLDGGVEQGNTSRHGFPASPVDGMGWDTTHDAIDVRGFSGNALTHWTWTNLLFTHWRGEIVKSNGQSTNGNLTIVNCIFRDGNATAINIYDSLLITNCLFDNLLQIGEYYQKYSTNTSYMVGNIFTNIAGNGMAFNGGILSCPTFVLSNNWFTVAGNAFATTPGDNIIVISNYFINCGNPIVIGEAGYQGYTNNQNIEVGYNTFSNCSALLQLGDASPYGSNTCQNVSFHNNLVAGIINSYFVSQGYGTNIYIYSNTIPLNSDGTIKGTTITLGARGAQMALFQTNNDVYTRVLYSATNQVLSVSYAQGARFQFVYRTLTNSVISLVTTNASQIPAGAAIIITNASFTDANSDGNLKVYSTSDLSDTPLTIPQYGVQTFYFTGAAWTNTPDLIPGSSYLLTVNNGSGGGTYLAGDIVPITGNTSVGYWTANPAIANTAVQSTTVTMPATNLTVTWNPTGGPTITVGTLTGTITRP